MGARQDELKPVYLIISEQRMLVDQALNRLRKRVADIADLDFNSQSFDAEGVNADDVIAACNTLPFMSDLRLVVLRNVEKLNKDALDKLAAYAGDPSPTTVLALAGEKLAKNLKLYKAVDKLGGVLERKAPGPGELPGVVRAMFAERGKQISHDAAGLLVELVGRDLQRLSVEMDKVISFVGDRTEVARADIDESAATTMQRTVFHFTDALGDRDCGRALRIAAELLGAGESEHGLHAMAVRMMRDLMAARSLIDRGQGSADVVASTLGRPPFVAKKLLRQARGFMPVELVALLQASAETEQIMKTSRDSRLALERWIVKVCAG